MVLSADCHTAGARKSWEEKHQEVSKSLFKPLGCEHLGRPAFLLLLPPLLLLHLHEHLSFLGHLRQCVAVSVVTLFFLA